eukprot:scaffold53882_cov39-Cyclotella_meneghiniana.AAC.2
MRHWDSQAAMVWMKRIFYPLCTKNSTRGDLAGKAFQSRPHNIIQHIHNETLGQSSSYGLDENLHMDTNSASYNSRGHN